MRIDGPTHHDADRHANAFESRAKTLIQRVLRSTAKDLPDNPTVDDAGRLLAEWTSVIDQEDFVGRLQKAYLFGADVVLRSLKDAAGMSFVAGSVDPLSALVIPRIRIESANQRMAYARNRLVNVGNDMWEVVRAEILAGIQDGKGIAPIRDRIISVAPFGQARAAVIARTEVNNAINAGALEQFRQVETPGKTKQWISTMDSRTRPEHADADGQTVGIDEMFNVGGEDVDCPGDGSPENSVNCRCCLGYDIPDDVIS